MSMYALRGDCEVHGTFYTYIREDGSVVSDEEWLASENADEFHPQPLPVRCDHEIEMRHVVATRCQHKYQDRNMWDGIVEHTWVCGEWTEDVCHTDHFEDSKGRYTVVYFDCPQSESHETEEVRGPSMLDIL